MPRCQGTLKKLQSELKFVETIIDLGVIIVQFEPFYIGQHRIKSKSPT